MTVKEHLQTLHEASAAHHKAMQKSHEKLADHYSKANEMDGHRTVVDEHEAMAASHEKMAEHHSSMLKAVVDEMAKADQVVPDRVSGVLTHFPEVRAVPRTGSPDLTKINVPIEFEKLYTIDND